MNVLLTSVGRRSYLVEYFKEAIGSQFKVVAVNSEALTSGMLVADKNYAVPRVDSDDYIPQLLDICQKEEIGLVVSLFDIDLPYLAKAREQFLERGIEVAVSNPEVIDIANDKWKTFKFLSENNIQTPRTYLNVGEALSSLQSKTIEYPVIVKPRWGMGSLSIFKAESEAELQFFFGYAIRQIKKSYLNILSNEEIDQSVVIQECINGDEFGLDIFNSLSGDYIQTVPKKKLAMRSGETDMAEIVNDERLHVLGKRLSERLKHRGNMDVDVLENASGELFVLELNARFGGGYPFSHLSGVDFPTSLIDMARRLEPTVNTVDYGCIGLKNISLLKVPSRNEV